MRQLRAFGWVCWVVLLAGGWALAQKKPLTVQDIMKFREIHDVRISEDGRWLAYEARPDRGDGQGVLKAVDGGQSWTVERGSHPIFSKDGRWVAMRIEPPAEEKEKAGKKAPKAGMALLETSSGEQQSFERIQSFAFSDDSAWLAYQRSKKDRKPEKESAEEISGKGKTDKKKDDSGTTLVLRRLADGLETEIAHVRGYAFDPESRFLAYASAVPGGESNSLSARDLKSAELEEITLAASPRGRYTHMDWSRRQSRLAFIAAQDDEDGKPGHGSLWIWQGEGEAHQSVAGQAVPEGWIIPSKNQVSWTRDGLRIFFGLRPAPEEGKEKPSPNGDDEAPQWDPFDVDALLGKRQVDVWHWNDPLINTNQKEMWPRNKDRTYRAVYHFDSGKVVALTDEEVPDLSPSENPRSGLALSNIPYRKEITWNGRFQDAFVVDIDSGSRKRIARKLPSRPQLSPQGRYVAYFEKDHWHLYDHQVGSTSNLTESLQVPFYNEDHDYPSSRPSYSLAGWLEEDAAVLIHDKYDLWKFPLPSGDPVCLTMGEGRQHNRSFTAQQLDDEALFFRTDETILLRAYHQEKKNYGIYATRADQPSLQKLVEEDKRFDLVAKAKEADVLVYTRQDYTEFPDLWVAGQAFENPRKVTDVNPQISEFAWGEEQLVQWNSLDGKPLQGVLIKPGNYQPGRRYPVLVYFYRFFSQRLHEFNQMVVNHRPNFPFYASNGYAVFLPDIRFEVGRPGFSATKCLVPGVQKLVDMGIADPEAVGLHGHSWSGYQTAFVITQTDIFAAAVAGAPVSNMTSAYSGIRWGTGLARQFQYEKAQSRIGGSLWEYPERYIENSPVFFADRINTPLLIQFGDEDGAVPWYQGIELYLAMRRLEKPCVFLQYRGEPHHLQKYPNKLDYTLKMKQYFDHYLKGAPAPDWITKGVPYQGK